MVRSNENSKGFLRGGAVLAFLALSGCTSLLGLRDLEFEDEEPIHARESNAEAPEGTGGVLTLGTGGESSTHPASFPLNLNEKIVVSQPFFIVDDEMRFRDSASFFHFFMHSPESETLRLLTVTNELNPQWSAEERSLERSFSHVVPLPVKQSESPSTGADLSADPSGPGALLYDSASGIQTSIRQWLTADAGDEVIGTAERSQLLRVESSEAPGILAYSSSTGAGRLLPWPLEGSSSADVQPLNFEADYMDWCPLFGDPAEEAITYSASSLEDRTYGVPQAPGTGGDAGEAAILSVSLGDSRTLRASAGTLVRLHGPSQLLEIGILRGDGTFTTSWSVNLSQVSLFEEDGVYKHVLILPSEFGVSVLVYAPSTGSLRWLIPLEASAEGSSLFLLPFEESVLLAADLDLFRAVSGEETSGFLHGSSEKGVIDYLPLSADLREQAPSLAIK